jgi:hypothetical protein
MGKGDIEIDLVALKLLQGVNLKQGYLPAHALNIYEEKKHLNILIVEIKFIFLKRLPQH